jgi:hypothetical protein
MNDLYLFIEDLKDSSDDTRKYSDILNLERELIEMSIMEELSDLPF